MSAREQRDIAALQDLAVDTLRALRDAGGESAVIGAVSSVLEIRTRPLIRGMVKATTTFRMGSKEERRADGKRKRSKKKGNEDEKTYGL